MSPFQDAWNLLKASEAQRLSHPDAPNRQQTVHPAIAGMLQRNMGVTPAVASESGSMEMSDLPDTFHTPQGITGKDYDDMPERFRTRNRAFEPYNAQFNREYGTPHQRMEYAAKLNEFYNMLVRDGINPHESKYSYLFEEK